ncbi:MAG: phosphatase PAP2 family protein [Eubacteriales bacterium]|nr:phosphatase PAP2 family protein [Eubacteriales bacterium]
MLPEWIHQMDIDLLLFIQEYLRADWMDGFWRFVTFLGDGGWFWIVTACLLMIFPKTRKAGLLAAASLALGALVTNLLLKTLVARVRPYDLYTAIELLVEPQADFSFPSGHTCAAFSAALIYMRALKRPWNRAAVILAALIAISRLYVGVHYPTDVLGGLLVGWLSSWIVWRLSGQRRTAVSSARDAGQRSQS